MLKLPLVEKKIKSLQRVKKMLNPILWFGKSQMSGNKIFLT